MAVTLGQDYARVRKQAWWFESGLGHGTAILTRWTFYLFPIHTLNAGATTRTKTDFVIGGQSPYDAISALVARPDLTGEGLEQQLAAWASQLQGPIRLDLAAVKRIRIFSGWFRRAVVFSEKETGYDFKPKGVRPSKQEMPAFVSMLANHPNVERK